MTRSDEIPLFRPPPLHPRLPTSTALDVWRLPLTPHLEALATARAVLSPDECARADRLIDPDKGARWTLARAGLKRVLALYVESCPSSILFERDVFQKPSLSHPVESAMARALRFNTTHSGGWALVAVANEREVGVDIEWVARRPEPDFEGLVRYAFSPRERSSWEEARDEGEEQGKLAFWRIWTRKEAYIKWRGTGLRCDLRAFDVSATPDASLIEARHDAAPRPDSVSMRGFWAHEQAHMGALAVGGAIDRIEWFDLRWDHEITTDVR